MRELAELGLQPQLEAAGIENLESVFFNRFGQFIYREPRGRHAGYALPEIGIHRGKLHRVLYEAVLQRLGAQACSPGSPLRGGATRRPAAPPCVSAAAQRCAACAGARRRGGGLRRRQLRRAPPVLSRGKAGVRRHQHLARRYGARAHPQRQELPAHRLDRDRQDGDLPHRRQRRRAGQPAGELGRRDSPRRRAHERLEQARPAAGLRWPSSRTGVSTGSTCRR